MAASDQTYRNQRWLDMTFGVTSALMLFSIVWMFVDDYNREWKPEQRKFRDVETAMSQRLALENIPTPKEIKEAEAALEFARSKRADQDQECQENKSKIHDLGGDSQRSNMRYNDAKADLESIKSFYDLEMEYSPDSSRAEGYKAEVARLETRLAEAKKEKDEVITKIAVLRQANDKIEDPVSKAVTVMKKVTDKFDAQVKTAILKRWGIGDSIRAWPIIDGFASPLKIHQFTIEDVPIDYNFKYVTRYDRCMTCHQGIDRPAYTRSMLASLSEAGEEQNKKLEEAREILRIRKDSFKGLPEHAFVPDPDELKLNEIPKSYLTQARISEFAAHPRLDLFVGSNSKHPAEQIGCSACHSGQGSSTSFSLASHTPNDFHSEERWKKEHGWVAIHDWDFPMLPQRFIESSCVKCHYQITDLIGSNNRQEAPKLLKGYNLLRENGCFGCHEINGRKKGREIGPDIRLEHFPPLDDEALVTPAERARIEADPDTRPGNMRKVGPSLFRIVEKTNPEWVAKWIRSPRDFRPDTKMPHYYGQTNNSPDVLPEEQKKFPDAEIQAITYVLFEQSKAYLAEAAKLRKEGPAANAEDQRTLSNLMNRANISDAEKRVIGDIKYRMRLRQTEPLVDRAPGYKGNAANGRLLFSERGCLACHAHDGTTTPQGAKGDKSFAPAMQSEAVFGPNLSQLAGKLGTKANDPASSRNWLVQWIMDPHQYSPRSRMPVTHLTGPEAADIAAWLLAQSPNNAVGPDWKSLQVKEPEPATLKSLARVYLIRLLSQSNLKKLEEGKLPDYVRDDLPLEEKELAKKYDPTSLKMYLGRKAIGRLGCFACHDIPGFDTAKPIGTELNEWGKKDPARLAFEDIKNFVKKTYHIVDSLTDEQGRPEGPVLGEDGKKKLPYEKFFSELLFHHQREGFLNQKLLDPRSYDYKRILPWDERSRMPQFRFARPRRHKGESDKDYDARISFEESQARQSVMTFVLGLVAEPIPFKSVNLPKGDRLAEVKGRQVLEKYNCGGCHLIRPGVFEFKVNKQVTQALEKSLESEEDPADHVFPQSNNWVGTNPKGDVLTAFSSSGSPGFTKKKKGGLDLRLTHALRFVGPDGAFKDLPNFAKIENLPKKDIIYPPQEALQSEKTLQAFLHDHGPYGGAFSNLLAEFLFAKDPGKYKGADNGNARIAVPPVLIGQGERTQGEWLYQFLLKPEQIRKESVLRMPRFNMSPDEAKTLVSYFAGVERINNTGIGLTFPFDHIPQQEDLDAPFWRERTVNYMSRLRKEKTKDAKGTEVTQLDLRLQELRPIWQQILTDYQNQLVAAKASAEAAKAKRKAVEDSKKNFAKESDYDDALQAANVLLTTWENEKERLEKLVKGSSPKDQQAAWEEREAYVTDGYRMLTKVCLLCHKVGNLQPSPEQLQGPSLDLAAKRLQPGWLERWIANPQRHLPYNSVMPANFPKNQSGKYQDVVAGSSLDQIISVRDVLMILPRAADLPVNRYLALPLTGAVKTGEKK